MQAEGSLETDNQTNIRRKGLRIALAVAVGLTWSVHAGVLIPFLGPFFAAQFLIGDSRPLPLGKALGLLVVILVAGTVMQFITIVAGHRPPILLILLGLIYFLCFFLQAKGKVAGPTVFFVLVVAIMVPLMAILNHDLASSILSSLVQGVLIGLLLMWVAHALLPDKGTPVSEPTVPSANLDAMRFAVCNAIILLIAVAACLTLNGLATAIVVPITVASLLSQSDVIRSMRTALGLVLVNLLGGVVASVAFAVYLLRPTGFSFFLIVLLVGLTIGGRAAQDDPSAKLYAGALTIFLIVFGMGVSPLPGSAVETFSTRIFYIVGAIAYTIFMVVLLWPQAKIDPSNRQAGL